MIIIEKKIEPGTWRFLGQRVSGLSPSDVPIAGTGLRAISRHVGGVVYRVGRIRLRDAFVIERGPLRLLYVRPSYSGYRYAAKRVFAKKDWAVDYDHLLGRALAEQSGFGYVLLVRTPPSVNRAHGSFERLLLLHRPGFQKLAFADDRVLDKWTGRGPIPIRTRQRPEPYAVEKGQANGLWLKRMGRWAYAMGVEDEDFVVPSLVRLPGQALAA